MSNDGANISASTLGQGVVTVVPATSNVERVYPFQVRLPAADTGLGLESKAQGEQIHAASVDRILRQIGTVPADLMAELDEALRLHLAL